MEACKRIIRSRSLLAFLIVATAIISVPPLFQTTWDGARYSYYPPFGTIRTDILIPVPVRPPNEARGFADTDVSEDPRIDQFGAVKILSFYAMPFIVLLAPLFLIRLLLRMSERATSHAVILSSLAISLLLTIFLIGIILLVGLLSYNLFMSFLGL